MVGSGAAAVVSLYGLPRELPLVERLAVSYRLAMEDTVRNPELCPHRLYLRLLSGPTAAPLPAPLHTHFTPVSMLPLRQYICQGQRVRPSLRCVWFCVLRFLKALSTRHA